MSRLYKTEGIILKHSYTGEADALLTIFTLERGKIRAVARGVKKTKSRLAGHVEPLIYCSMMLAEGRNFDIVSGCDTLESFAAIRADLWLLSCGLYVADLTDRLSVDGAENRPLFYLLLNALESLRNGIDSTLVLRYFELRSLACTGYLPELWKCVVCHRKLEAVTNYFSPAASGLLCPNCRAKEGLSRPVTMSSVKLLRFFIQNKYGALSRLKVSPHIVGEIEDVMQGYITYVLECEVKSARWLHHLRISKAQSVRTQRQENLTSTRPMGELETV